MSSEEDKRDTLPAPPPTEPENSKPEPGHADLPTTFHRWCAPELGACGICDEYPMLRAAHAQKRDEAGRA